jgi:hypothetical protein
MLNMDKRYQVFVSSTFQDLQEERQEVMQALLELDCIPAGMELFPAANEDQWSLIKRVIDDCDYYIVIIGGRYGSMGPEGISYTEMEYRHAIGQGKPVIAFLHKDPGTIPASRTEPTTEGKARLDRFRSLAQQKMVRYWETPTDLGSQVSRSLIKLIKSNPAVGWVRADQIPEEGATEEILRLRKRIEELETGLQAVRNQAPEGTDTLAQGDDKFIVDYSFTAYNHEEGESSNFKAGLETNWNEIFGVLSPLMIEEATETSLRTELNSYVADQQLEALSRRKQFKSLSLSDFQVADADFHTIKIQLRALGLITKSTKQRSIKDKATYWMLTPYGDSVMTRLRAIQRNSGPPLEAS